MNPQTTIDCCAVTAPELLETVVTCTAPFARRMTAMQAEKLLWFKLGVHYPRVRGMIFAGWNLGNVRTAEVMGWELQEVHLYYKVRPPQVFPVAVLRTGPPEEDPDDHKRSLRSLLGFIAMLLNLVYVFCDHFSQPFIRPPHKDD